MFPNCAAVIGKVSILFISFVDIIFVNLKVESFLM